VRVRVLGADDHDAVESVHRHEKRRVDFRDRGGYDGWIWIVQLLREGIEVHRQRGARVRVTQRLAECRCEIDRLTRRAKIICDGDDFRHAGLPEIGGRAADGWFGEVCEGHNFWIDQWLVGRHNGRPVADPRLADRDDKRLTAEYEGEGRFLSPPRCPESLLRRL